MLEATRRTAGWVLPITRDLLHPHTFYGPLLDLVGLGMIAHRGYDLARIVGTIYMTLEGVFGVPLDVAASYIILFSIYGAVLGASGAGKFFLEWSLAAVGTSGGGAGPGRAVTRRGPAARHRVGKRRRQHRDARLGRVADAEARRLQPAHGRRDPLGRRHRRNHLSARAGRGGVHHRGVPAHHVSEGDRDGGDTGAALFLLDLPDDRGRHARAPARGRCRSRRRRCGSSRSASGYHFLAVVGIPLMLILGMSPFRAVFFSMLDRGRAQLRRSRERALAAPPARRALRRRAQRASGGVDDGNGGHHRWRR